MECKHFPYGTGGGRCSSCSTPPTLGAKPKVDRDLWIDPKPPVDREAVLAAAIAEGKVCGRCLTERVNSGCAHDRRDVYEGDPAKGRIGVVEQVQQFLETMHVLPEIERKQGKGIALGTLRRRGLRAGLTVNDMTADRLEVIPTLEELGAKFGGYHQPRVNESTHLPV